MVQEQFYSLNENLDQVGYLNIGFVSVLLLLIEYYFIVHLNPNFNCSGSFVLS